VEDRIRDGKDTGLRNLPLHDAKQNRILVAVAALAADLRPRRARPPTGAATYKPKRLRFASWPSPDYRQHPPRRILRIDPAWPRAEAITTAHARLSEQASEPKIARRPQFKIEANAGQGSAE
jgi:hypothetical protein